LLILAIDPPLSSRGGTSDDYANPGHRTVGDVVRVSTGEDRGAPGVILALQTFGQDVTFHPHVHALATEGLVRPDETFVPVPTIDAPLLEHAFRRRGLCHHEDARGHGGGGS
jgi:hypothetical protein